MYKKQKLLLLFYFLSLLLGIAFSILALVFIIKSANNSFILSVIFFVLGLVFTILGSVGINIENKKMKNR